MDSWSYAVRIVTAVVSNVQTLGTISFEEARWKLAAFAETKCRHSSWIGIIVAALFVIVGTLRYVCSKFRREKIPFEERDWRAVLITGCDSGLGERAAVRLAREGFKVFACVKNIKSEGARTLRRKSLEFIDTLVGCQVRAPYLDKDDPHANDYKDIYEAEVKAVNADDGTLQLVFRDGATYDRHPVDQIELENGPIVVLEMDVRKDAAVKHARDVVARWMLDYDGKLHAVVNNAGVQLGSLADWTKLSDVTQMIQINFIGTVRVTQAFAPLLFNCADSVAVPRRLINVSSLHGLLKVPGLSGYAASQHALDSYTEILRMEYKAWRDGIRVVTINPDIFLSPMTSTYRVRIERAFGSAPADVRDYYGEDYLERVLKFAKIRLESAQEPTLVVDDLVDAVASVDPKPRYVGRSWFAFVCLSSCCCCSASLCARDRCFPFLLRHCNRPKGRSSAE